MAHYNLSTNYYTSRSAPPCTPDFTTQFDVSVHFFPLYQPPPTYLHPSRKRSPPPPYSAYKKTGQYRCLDQPPRYRSSFALSDILEENEVDVVIVESLLNWRSSSSTSTLQFEVKQGFPAKLLGFFAMLRDKCYRAATGMRYVVNAGSNTDLDLLA